MDSFTLDVFLHVLSLRCVYLPLSTGLVIERKMYISISTRTGLLSQVLVVDVMTV